MLVCIDPGHGGRDPGAIGHGLIEKNTALDISVRVKRALDKAGIRAVMTRSSDLMQWDELELQDRCDTSNHAGADCFVSVHCNAAAAAAAYGSETFHFRGSANGAALARAIQNGMNRNADEIPERRVIGAGFYVLANTDAPAALVECGFLTNPKDASLLALETFRERQAQGIASGIYQWLKG